jgi:two-component sensor histidine kinase
MNLRGIIVRYWTYFVRAPRLLPLLVFMATLFLTVLSTVAFERSERDSQQLRLQVKADEVAATLQQNMATNIAILRSGRALFAAVSEVDRKTFGQFVNELQIIDATKGVKGVGWSQKISATAVPAFEKAMREQGLANFVVWPYTVSSSAPVHSIIYIAPMTAPNQNAIGYNMYTESSRQQAMRYAARTGAPTATRPVVLLQDRELGLPGLLIYVPVYRGNVGRLDQDRREDSLLGFVYSPIGVQEFVEAARLNREYIQASISIFDVSDGGNTLIYKMSDHIRGNYSAKQTVQIANRQWRLVLKANRDDYLTPLAAIILALGIALSLLLSALTALIVLGGRNAQTLLAARQEHEAVRNILTRELTHRVKNTLATVTSLAMLTRRGATSVDAYADALTARLRALSATHDLLTHRDWSHAPLRGVLEAELAPFSKASDVRLNLSGPDVVLAPNIALSLGLAVHELVTNAAKYGAFSVRDGTITIDWVLTQNSDAVRLNWRESGGPPVQQPETRGFGSDLVEKLMARELNSEVRINFHPDGVRCELSVPILKSQTDIGSAVDPKNIA